MLAKPLRQIVGGYEPCDASDATHIQLHMPGPLPNRIIPVHELFGGWVWNKSVKFPTLTPSVLTKGGDINGEHVCHSFIRDGMAIFLPDCSHEFAGKTADLLEVE